MSTTDEARYLNALLGRAKGGDRGALDDLCRALEERLRVVIQSWRWGWSRADREDVLQNTLTVFAERYVTVEDNPHHFALRVMRNKAGDAIRHAKTIDRMTFHRTTIQESGAGDPPGIDLAGAPDPETEYGSRIDGTELIGRIRAEVVRLPQFCRLFFIAMLEGRQVNEVWQVIQSVEPRLSRSGFDKRIFLCRQRLREAVGLIR